MPPITPRQEVPALNLKLLSGQPWQPADDAPEHFSLLVAYRGLHCPICKTYLQDLERHLDGLYQLGVDVLAFSTDVHERAQQAKTEWGLENLRIGYGLGIDQARAWGLYISSGRGATSVGVEEPQLFNEPGVFLLRRDQTLYAATLSTMPFARPHFREILGALEFIIEKDYPPRGEA